MLSKKQIAAATLMAESNMRDDEIASSLEVGKEELAKWKRQPEFKQAVNDASHNLITDWVPKLIKNQIRLAMNADSENVQLQATQYLLDQVGFTNTPKDKGITRVTAEAPQKPMKVLKAR